MNAITTNAITTTRATVGIAAVLGAAALGVATLAGPALANPSDTDRPKLTETHHDFGENWSLGAPRNGGHLEWELIGGVTHVDLTGNHYLTDQACGTVHVEYYDASHTEIGHDDSALHCAPGNPKAQWTISESFADSRVEHVHVELKDSNGNQVGASEVEDFD
jgi:hypothetical protein